MTNEDKKFENLGEMAQEIRNVLGSVSGCKGRLTESVSLSYVCVVDTEEQKEGIDKVGALLAQQAAKFGIDLEVASALESEIEEARRNYQEYMEKKDASPFST